MKKFEIVTSTSFGHKIIVEANTEEEAEEMAREEIDEGDGVDFKNGWNTGFNADWDVTSVRKIK